MGNPSLNADLSFPQLFEIVGKQQTLFHLKCKAYLLHKSFPTWGSSSLNAQLSFPQREGVKILPLKCTAIKLPHHLKMHSYPSPQILSHMGKNLSFLPPWIHGYPWPHGEGVTLASSKCTVHPSSASPLNTTLPFPTNPVSSICMEGSFPLQNAKPLQILPYKIFFVSLFFMLFLFMYTFFSYLLFRSNSFFPKKRGILPQSGKINPQRLRRIIE